MSERTDVIFNYRMMQVAERTHPDNYDRELEAQAVNLLRDAFIEDRDIKAHATQPHVNAVPERNLLLRSAETLEEFGVAIDALYGQRTIHALQAAEQTLPAYVARLTGGKKLSEASDNGHFVLNVLDVQTRAKQIISTLKEIYSPLEDRTVVLGTLA